MCNADELMVSNSGKSLAAREKPVPPPKPAQKTYKYDSLKDFLEKEGEKGLSLRLNSDLFLFFLGFDPSIGGHLELGPATCQGSLFKLGGITLIRAYWPKPASYRLQSYL